MRKNRKELNWNKKSRTKPMEELYFARADVLICEPGLSLPIMGFLFPLFLSKQA